MTISQIWDYGLRSIWIPVDTQVDLSVVLAVYIPFVLMTAVFAYLLGSINLSIIISKKFYGEDIREYGSGNAGMTNVMRTYGKKMAAITFGGDFLKAVIASLIGRLFLGFFGAYLAGFFCFVGHIFPCYYKFKGGKGIVTAAAMVLMTDWRIFLILVALFVLIVALTKYISLGSVVGLAFYPIVLDRMWVIFAYGMRPRIVIIFAIGVMILGIWGHRKNIKRILNHTENKFTFKVKDKAVKAEKTDDKEKENKK